MGGDKQTKIGDGGGLGGVNIASSYRCTQEDTKEPDSLDQPVYCLLCSGQRILGREMSLYKEVGGVALFPESSGLGTGAVWYLSLRVKNCL